LHGNTGQNQLKKNRQCRKARLSCSSPFKNVKRELLKSYEKAYLCGLSAENCEINKSQEKYTAMRQPKQRLAAAQDPAIAALMQSSRELLPMKRGIC
jgi:hypothetical protein